MKSRAAWAGWLVVFGIAGCATVDRGRVPVSDLPAELSSEESVVGRTDPRVLFYVGAAEISGRRDQHQAAAEYYAKAARLAEDPRVAERAVQVAAFAKDEALTLAGIRRWLEIDPIALEPNRLAAVLYLRRGDLESSWQHVVAMLEQENSANVWNAVIKMLGGSEQRDIAAEIFRRLNAAYTPPADEAIIQQLSDLAVRFGALELAERYASAAIELNPNNAASYQWRGRLRTSLDRLPEALEDLARAVELEPENIQARQTYAALLAEMGRHDEAIEQLGQLPPSSLVLYSQSVYSHAAKDPEQALAFYRQLEEFVAEDEDEKYFLLGQLAETLERPYDEIVEWYNRVRQGERLNDARLRSAVVLGTHGEMAQARVILRRLQNGNEQTATRAYLAEAGLLRQTDEHEQALDVYSNALTLLPDNSDLLFARALLAEELDRLDIAEADLRRILAERPDDANALNALGYTLADRTDRYDEALDLIQRAFEQLPDQAAIVDSMGWVHYKLGNLDTALEHLEHALSIEFDSEIVAHLGEVLWALGRQDEALKTWALGLEKAPDSEIILGTRKRLTGQ